MDSIREKATAMRKSGKSYGDIKKQLGVSRSTLSDWFRGQKWSEDITREAVKHNANLGSIRLVVLNSVRAGRLKQLYADAVQDALSDFNELRFHPLFISGMVLYWSHGDKTSKNRVMLSSSDHEVINIFGQFLVKICGISKIRVQLLIDPKMSEDLCKKYWSHKCGLKYEQFGRSILVRHRKYHGKIHYGVCNMIVSSAYLKRKFIEWLKLLKKEMNDEGYMRLE